MAIKILQLHKRASYEYKFIQDKYTYSLEDRCYAIADGTTQSFYSEIWAAKITSAFVKCPVFDPRRLMASFAKAAEEFKGIPFSFNANPALASLERVKQKAGATATFVGIQMNADHTVSVISCGDSNVFILRNEQLLGYPFSSVDALDQNTYFLNTEKLLADEVDESFFTSSQIRLQKGDKVLLATDALSRYLLSGPNRYQEVLSILSFEDLRHFCERRWEDTMLEEDDITAVIIDDFHADSVSEIIPPASFSFPKVEEAEFVPFTQALFDEQLTEQEMQHLNNSLQQLNSELDQLKRKGKFQENLLIIAIGLIVVNLLLFFFIKGGQPVEPAAGKEENWEQLYREEVETSKGYKQTIKQLEAKLDSKVSEDKSVDSKAQSQASIDGGEDVKTSETRQPESNTASPGKRKNKTTPSKPVVVKSEN